MDDNEELLKTVSIWSLLDIVSFIDLLAWNEKGERGARCF